MGLEYLTDIRSSYELQGGTETDIWFFIRVCSTGRVWNESK